jgi:hypothetical protein
MTEIDKKSYLEGMLLSIDYLKKFCECGLKLGTNPITLFQRFIETLLGTYRYLDKHLSNKTDSKNIEENIANFINEKTNFFIN